MNRRTFLATSFAAVFMAGAASARRSGDRGDRDRGTRAPRGPRLPRAGGQLRVAGIWAIGVILLLDGSDEECEVIGHDGLGNSICVLMN